ncbi:hypothetical protein N7492_003889 [Penicillium capsulatum]|uniref:Uncharacterized protein n=1 Tax=Penicillium capsulatum TaxID=69766 RepID=A0A9W9IMQ8_9EURO|nr:hypothetical protein N7492_003889 [Penicillium capsulatum]KAJ6121531.1 hypothetical protein N7512_003996 [Penicillium capsulatum]
MPDPPRHPIIHLNGFPGVGKLTIARHLTSRLSANLIHNHLLVNPADAVLHRTQPGYQTLRRAIRAAVLDALADEPATYGTSYVFTDFQSSDELGASVCAEYIAAAVGRDAPFIPVVLLCDEDVNMQRLVSPERETYSKLMDVELVARFRREKEVCRLGKHPNFFELDVSGLEPGEAARRIYDHVVRVCPEVK